MSLFHKMFFNVYKRAKIHKLISIMYLKFKFCENSLSSGDPMCLSQATSLTDSSLQRNEITALGEAGALLSALCSFQSPSQ